MLQCVFGVPLVLLLHGYSILPSTAAVYYSLISIQPWGPDYELRLLGYTFLLPIFVMLLPAATYYILLLLCKHCVLGKPRMLADGQPDLSTAWLQLRHWIMGRLMDSALLKLAVGTSRQQLGPAAVAGGCQVKAPHSTPHSTSGHLVRLQTPAASTGLCYSLHLATTFCGLGFRPIDSVVWHTTLLCSACVCCTSAPCVCCTLSAEPPQ